MKQVTAPASSAASVVTGEFCVAVIVVPLNGAGFQFDTVGRGTTQHRTANSAANPSASQAKPHRPERRILHVSVISSVTTRDGDSRHRAVNDAAAVRPPSPEPGTEMLQVLGRPGQQISASTP